MVILYQYNFKINIVVILYQYILKLNIVVILYQYIFQINIVVILYQCIFKINIVVILIYLGNGSTIDKKEVSITEIEIEVGALQRVNSHR